MADAHAQSADQRLLGGVFLELDLVVNDAARWDGRTIHVEADRFSDAAQEHGLVIAGGEVPHQLGHGEAGGQRRHMQKAGAEPAADAGPAEFSAFIAKEIPLWGEAVKAAGVTLQ